MLNHKHVKTMQPPKHHNDNESLPVELQIMPFNRRLMTLIGIQGPERNRCRFVVAFGLGVFVIFIPKAFWLLGLGSSEVNTTIKGLSEVLFQVNLFTATLLMALNRKSFERLFQLWSDVVRDVTAKDEPRDCYELIREQNSKIDKFAKFYCCYCCFGPFVYWFPAMAMTYVRYLGNGSEPLQFELPMEQGFYGLHINTDITHYNFYMACSLPTYYVCGYFSLLKVTTLLIIIQYCTVSFKVVELRIRNLVHFQQHGSMSVSNGAISISRTKAEELIKIVQLHNKSVEITHLVEKIVNIPLAMQFLSCVMFWCLVIFYISSNIDFILISIMVTFWLSLIETFGFSFLGSELTGSAAAVAKAIYDSNDWYNDSVPLQRYYRLILQRAQRETGVTAAKFFIVGRSKFLTVVQMTYSYYLVLKDTINN